MPPIGPYRRTASRANYRANSTGPGALVSPADFEGLLRERTRLEHTNPEFCSDLWRRDKGHVSADSLKEIANRFSELAASSPLARDGNRRLSTRGKNGGPHRQIREKLLSLIEQVHSEAAGAQEILIQHATTWQTSRALSSKNKRQRRSTGICEQEAAWASLASPLQALEAVHSHDPG